MGRELRCEVVRGSQWGGGSDIAKGSRGGGGGGGRCAVVKPSQFISV